MAKFKMKNWRGDQISQEVRKAGARALYLGASHLLTESAKIAPLDEGTLTQTAGIEVDEFNGRASVYYTTPYAVRLHEHPSLNIRRGRQRKYLENPLLQERETINQIFRDELKDVFKG